jgi:hypothetical protein
VRTLSLSEIAQLRPRLIAEHTVYGSHEADNKEVVVSGIADALAYDSKGMADVVIDWKSDVEIDESRLSSYRAQLNAYRQETGAQRGLLVFMTLGKIIAM